MGHSHRQTVLLMYLWAALFAGLVVGLSVLRIGLIYFAVITLGAIGALLLATAPKLRPWHSTGGGRRERPRGSRLRSDDPLSATPDLAAPAGGPVPGVLPPAALSSGGSAYTPAHGAPRHNGASPNGAAPNGVPPNGASSSGAEPNNGAHVRRPRPHRAPSGPEPAPPAAPPPWSRRG
jgi:UDP-GlcNAc:undecaprenyl-phosphate GlcNAc-1-phosphate transferase